MSIATKVSKIPPFDHLINFFLHVSDSICTFARRMLQPFAISTLVVIVIGVRRKVD